MKHRNGGKLLIFVVGAFFITATQSCDRLLREREASPYAMAISGLRTIGTAEAAYQDKYQRFGSLPELLSEGDVDQVLGSGIKGGYIFEVRNTDNWFAAVARPVTYNNETSMSFYTSTDYRIHGADRQGAEATADDPLIP